MAAKIEYVYSCPRCGEGITSKSLNTRCPTCQLVLGTKEVEPYEYPYTMVEQHHKYGDSRTQLDKLINIPKDKAASMLNDALLIVETFPAQKAQIDDIRFMAELAVRVGDIAQKYLDYLDAGGRHVPNIIISLDEQNKNNQENKNESLPTSTIGENTT